MPRRLIDGDTVTQAPLVVRASARSRPRVAVVLPTSTWQAYNFTRCGRRRHRRHLVRQPDARERTARPSVHGRRDAALFHQYDRPFLRWLRASGHDADFLGDDDLDRVPDAATLARRYDLLVFPGHHEYVTRHELDLIEQYRDRGGNLAFLSADNLHWRVERHGHVLRRKEQWRALRHPRPEASIVGVQYRASDDGTHRGAYVVRAPAVLPGSSTGRASHAGIALRLERGRDLRHDRRLAAGHLCRRRDPEPARRGADRADDVLRDGARREGVRGGRVLPREPLAHRSPCSSTTSGGGSRGRDATRAHRCRLGRARGRARRCGPRRERRSTGGPAHRLHAASGRVPPAGRNTARAHRSPRAVPGRVARDAAAARGREADPRSRPRARRAAGRRSRPRSAPASRRGPRNARRVT